MRTFYKNHPRQRCSGEARQTRRQGEAEGGGSDEGGEWQEFNLERNLKTQVNEKRGDVEAKFRPEGMNGNGVASGKAQLNGNGHGAGSGLGFQIYGKKNCVQSTMFIFDDASMLFCILVLKPKCPGDSESEQGGTSLISSLLLFLCGLAVVAAGLFK